MTAGSSMVKIKRMPDQAHGKTTGPGVPPGPKVLRSRLLEREADAGGLLLEPGKRA